MKACREIQVINVLALHAEASARLSPTPRPPCKSWQ